MRIGQHEAVSGRTIWIPRALRLADIATPTSSIPSTAHVELALMMRPLGSPDVKAPQLVVPARSANDIILSSSEPDAGMKFFFHLTGAVSKKDTKGVDLSGMAAARQKAATVLCEHVRDHPDAIWGGKDLRLEVSDRNDLVFFAIMIAGFDTPLIQQ